MTQVAVWMWKESEASRSHEDESFSKCVAVGKKAPAEDLEVSTKATASTAQQLLFPTFSQLTTAFTCDSCDDRTRCFGRALFDVGGRHVPWWRHNVG